MKKYYPVLLALVAFSFLLSTVSAQTIFTAAGNGIQGYSGDGGPATAAELNWPANLALDRSGNIFIADQFNNRIRRVDNATGIISTVAGIGAAGYSGDGGPATSAEVNYPSSLTVDDSDNIYISDYYNSRIRKVEHSTGLIRTIAGNGIAGMSGNGGPATAAELNFPHQVSLDTRGNFFIADENNNIIRKVNMSTGIISLFAGNGIAGYSGDGGNAKSAELFSPKCVIIDDSENVYIADFDNNRIRKVNGATGIITTFAGNGNPGYGGDGGPATMAEVNGPYRIILDSLGNLFIATGSDNLVRWVKASTDTINTLAGNGAQGFSGDGGPATAAEMNLPTGVTTGKNGTIFIADFTNSRIRRVTALSASAKASNISCNGGNNGSLTATATGITPPFTYSWTPGGETTASISGLSAGSYTLSITDNIGDTGSTAFLIKAPAQLTVLANSVRNVHCFGGNDGEATASTVGGTSPYKYIWSNASTRSSASALIAGTYSLTVTDKNGCTATSAATITQPNLLTGSAFAINNVSCHGGNNGNAFIMVNGGVSPYTYLWSGGPAQTTDTADGLSAITYTVHVTDSNGCMATTAIAITQPAALHISADSSKGVSCFGGNNGSVIASVSGGVSPYTYVWSDAASQTTAKASGLSTGSYRILVTDGNGCTDSATFLITEPALLAVAANTVKNVLCYGGNSGEATSVASGGTSPYKYLWSNGGTRSLASALSAGIYSLTVTDKNGCSATVSNAITQPYQLTDSAFAISNVSCHGGSNGIASAGVSGGVRPYTYLWLGGPAQATDTASMLSAGTYTLQVMDSNGCTATSAIAITQPAVLHISTDSIKGVSCFGENNGSVTTAVSGGISPYTYVWNDAASQTTAKASGLIVGTYSVLVTDSNGCTDSATVIITQPSFLIFSAHTVTNVSCKGGNNGSAIARAVGGTLPYSYLWSDAASQTTATARGLSIGTYTVNITDKHGCTSSSSAIITQPSAIAITADSIGDSGTCNGAVWTVVSGGVPPYAYLWTGGGTTDSIYNQCSGKYCCLVTDSNGCQEGVCVHIFSDAGISRATTASAQLTVYPDPSNGIFTMQWAGVSGQLTVEIYNVLGQLVYSGSYQLLANSNQLMIIDISDKPAGVYLYSVTGEDGSLIGKGKIVIDK